jgi:hypothetical protein
MIRDRAPLASDVTTPDSILLKRVLRSALSIAMVAPSLPRASLALLRILGFFVAAMISLPLSVSSALW